MAFVDYSSYVLVDRALQGGTEFMYDGVPYVFKPGQVKKPVPGDVAKHIFTTEHTCVWTLEGEYVNRFALEAAPGGEESFEAFITNVLGVVPDSDPIEMDLTRAEGWDTRAVERPGRLIQERVPQDRNAFRDRQQIPANVAAMKG